MGCETIGQLEGSPYSPPHERGVYGVGGQAVRVQLTIISLSAPHLLVLGNAFACFLHDRNRDLLFSWPCLSFGWYKTGWISTLAALCDCPLHTHPLCTIALHCMLAIP